jgi:hypothetical protein
MSIFARGNQESQMAKLRAIPGGKSKEKIFSLIYGLRLYPAGAVAQVSEGGTILCDGTQNRVPLHLLEGTREQIRAQLLASIDAFFDIYGDDAVAFTTPSCVMPNEGIEEPGC